MTEHEHLFDGDIMGPEERASDSLRSQRTRPALPGATATTLPLNAQRPFMPTLTKGSRRVALLLLVLGVLLEVIYIALYPLFATFTGIQAQGQQQEAVLVRNALTGSFPWLPHLYWTQTLPALPRALAHISWLNLVNTQTQNLAASLLTTILLLLATLIVLIAFSVLHRIMRSTPISATLCFTTLFALTILFSITMMLSPTTLNIFSQDMLTYGLYGRMITFHHMNPYSVAPASFPHDLLQPLPAMTPARNYGPIWLDTSFSVSLLAGGSIANILLGFRLLGLLTHLSNALLIWSITSRLKPQQRLSLTLLYAWNPLILFFGIAYMHQEIVLAFMVLLAIFFFQRQSPTIGWVFILLTALTNLLWLPLLLLFVRYMVHESRILRVNQQLLWWLGMIVASCIVVILAYAPYWHALGIAGLATQMYHTFLPETASNSLDASLLKLPIASHILWILAPIHWSLLALAITLLFLVLGMLLADTLELIILFCCWILLTLIFLLPTYAPWYAIAPVILAICSTHQRTRLLAILLTLGTLLSIAFLLTTSWAGEALITIGVPLVLWGWLLFFSATWQMIGERNAQERRAERQQHAPVRRSTGFSRPPRSRF